MARHPSPSPSPTINCSSASGCGPEAGGSGSGSDRIVPPSDRRSVCQTTSCSLPHASRQPCHHTWNRSLVRSSWVDGKGGVVRGGGRGGSGSMGSVFGRGLGARLIGALPKHVSASELLPAVHTHRTSIPTTRRPSPAQRAPP